MQKLDFLWKSHDSGGKGFSGTHNPVLILSPAIVCQVGTPLYFLRIFCCSHRQRADSSTKYEVPLKSSPREAFDPSGERQYLCCQNVTWANINDWMVMWCEHKFLHVCHARRVAIWQTSLLVDRLRGGAFKLGFSLWSWYLMIFCFMTICGLSLKPVWLVSFKLVSESKLPSTEIPCTWILSSDCCLLLNNHHRVINLGHWTLCSLFYYQNSCYVLAYLIFLFSFHYPGNEYRLSPIQWWMPSYC